MSNGLRATAVVLWGVVCCTMLNANDDPAEKRRARLVELAKSLPIIDTSENDCPNFDLKCRGQLDKGAIQIEVGYRKDKQFDIAVTNTSDDTPIAVWTKKRLVTFEPWTPLVYMTDNVDLILQFAGTTEKFCAPEFKWNFGAKQTTVRLDVPSMLLSAAGKLIDEGSTAGFTRMSLSDSDLNRRLLVEFNRTKKTLRVRLHDSKSDMARGSIELRLDPDTDGVLVKSPTSDEVSTITTTASVNAVGLNPAQIQELGKINNRVLTVHLALNGSRFQDEARKLGRVIDWPKLATHRDIYGRQLRSLLIERAPPAPEELARQNRVSELANRFPVLDTRRPDCPPFLVRGRLHGDSGACDISLRHRGDNQLEVTVMTVETRLPYLACVDQRALALDSVRPEAWLVDSFKMQWTLEGAGGTQRCVFSANTEPKFEQFANINLRSLILNGFETVHDAGSNNDFVRLIGTTSSGTRSELEWRPGARESKCYLRQGDDSGVTEIEITVNPQSAAPLAKFPDREAIGRIVPLLGAAEKSPAVEVMEMLTFMWKCVFSNRAPFDAGAREAYSRFDFTSPDWEVVKSNQSRIGRQLRELMAIPDTAQTPDDTPIAPQLAAEDAETLK